MNPEIDNLSSTDLLEVLRHEMRYQTKVPDIMEFLKEDYYAGSIYYDKRTGRYRIYDIWLKALQDVFPNNVTTKTYISVSGAIGCLRGNTRIRLLSGKSITMKELSETNKNGCDWIYAFDIKNKTWTPALAMNCHLSGKNIKIYRVTFEDGTYAEGTYNHPFLQTNGEYKQLIDLKQGDSIESLYLSRDNKWKFYQNYEIYYDRFNRAWYPTHRKVIHELYNLYKCHVHPTDHNAYNNDPSNLDIFDSNADHLYYNNHIVKYIEFVGYDDVYDIVVPNYNNFGVEDQNGNLIFTHNTGKSTFSQVVLLYDIYKLMCLENCGKNFLELIGLTSLQVAWFNIFKYKAAEQIGPVANLVNSLPCFQYFKTTNNPNRSLITVQPASTTKDIISRDTIAAALSEINFFSYTKAYDIINSIISRQESRFQKGVDLLVRFILDSSDVNANSPTELFTAKSAYANKFYKVKATIWNAKPNMYFRTPNNLGELSFKVYAGDSQIQAHIMVPGESTALLDVDRIIDVPNELYSNFSIDTKLALQEKAGISLINTGLLFSEQDRLDERFTLPKYTKDVEIIDFYTAEKITDLEGIMEAIDALPRDRYLYIGLDSGITNDKYGFAIAYADGVTYTEVNDVKVPDMFIKVPFAISFSRNVNQETPINKIRDFIIEISRRKSIKIVGLDTYQSRQILQELKQNSIKAKFVSVDRSDTQYLTFKRLVLQDRIQLTHNKLLIDELKCLGKFGNKIDHTSMTSDLDYSAKGGGVNSKDVADAVVRAIYMIYEDGIESMDLPDDAVEEKYESYDKLLDMLDRKRFITSKGGGSF